MNALLKIKTPEMWVWSLICQLFILPVSIWFGMNTSLVEGLLMWLLLDVVADFIIVAGWWE